MTHTTRIYNNPKIKKAQRFNLDDETNKHPILGTTMSHQVGIPLTKRSWICMGKCPMCRDKNNEPRLIRKRLKEQFRVILKEEIKEELI